MSEDRAEQWDHREGVWHDLEGAALEAVEALTRVLHMLKRHKKRSFLGLTKAQWEERHGMLLEALDAINDRRTDEGEWLGTPEEETYYGEAPKEGT